MNEEEKQAALKSMRGALAVAAKRLGKSKPEPKKPAKFTSLGIKGQIGLDPGGKLPGFPKTSAARMAAFSDELAKLGAGYPDKPKRPEQRKPQHPAATIAKSMAGLGVGTAAGYGLAKAMENIARKKGFPVNKLIPAAAMAAGAMGAIAGPMLHTYERKHMDDYARSRS